MLSDGSMGMMYGYDGVASFVLFNGTQLNTRPKRHSMLNLISKMEERKRGEEEGEMISTQHI